MNCCCLKLNQSGQLEEMLVRILYIDNYFKDFSFIIYYRNYIIILQNLFFFPRKELLQITKSLFELPIIFQK